MGGFHQLHVKKRFIYKHSNCIGIREWCIDAGIITPGSATAQVMEECHYYRCMHLHKERFDTLVQFRFEKMKSQLLFQSFEEA